MFLVFRKSAEQPFAVEANFDTAPFGLAPRLRRVTRGRREILFSPAWEETLPYLFFADFLAVFFAGFFAAFLAGFFALFFAGILPSPLILET